MKKKVSPSKTKSAGVKKTTPKTRKTSSPQISTISYQRIVIFSAIVLAVVAVVGFNKPAVTQSVAGVSVAKGLFAEATIPLPEVDGAVSYNIYYKQKSDKNYDNAVRNVPVTAAVYTISHLNKGAAYEYKVSAVDSEGSEFWWSPIISVTNIKPM